MTNFENKIIDKFRSKVVLNSSLEDIDEKDQARIEQFILSALAQQREELVRKCEKLKTIIPVATSVYERHEIEALECRNDGLQEVIDSLTSSVPEEKEGLL